MKLFFCSVILLFGVTCYAQTAAEHESHHPGAAAADAAKPDTAMPSAKPMGGAGGMGDMMKGMMEGMGGAKQKEFYPSLMTLPTLTEQAHSDLELKAFERMRTGTGIMNQGILELTDAAEADDYARMKDASASLSEGLAQFNSGIATHEALTNGESPQAIGLSWYKKNLSLTNDHELETAHRTLFGLSIFHIFVMSLLAIFSAVMIAMYYFKMRRATKLLTWLQTGSKNVAEVKSDSQAKPAAPDTSAKPPAAAPPAAAPPAAAPPAADTPAKPADTPAKPADTPAKPADTPAKPADTPVKPAAADKPIATPLWKGKLKVAAISSETPSVKTFRFVPPEGGNLPFTYLAGQFLTLSAVIDGKPIKRAYTISSHPCIKTMLEITIKREDNGLVSRYMHDVLHEGDLIDLEAASGKLTFSGVTGEGVVLIGGGVGITPLMSVLRCLISCGMKNEIHLLYACKTLDDFVYHEELRQLQERNSNLKLLVAVEKLVGKFPGAFEGRLTKEKIQEAVPKITDLRVHLCGPPPMMTAMKNILLELKVPKEQIKEEAFGSAKKPPPKTAAPATSTTTAAAPAAPAANPAPDAKPPAPSTGLKKVTFTKAGKTVEIHEDESVLELSETSGVEIPFQCRVGTCGVCKVKLVSGDVTMAVEDALTEEDKQAKVILACQAKAQTDLEVEEP